MRKLLTSFVGATVAAGALVITATPAFASTCATATPMGTAGATEMGTQTRAGTVGIGTTEQWWEHSTNLANRTVTVSHIDGASTLSVYQPNCTSLTLICSASASVSTSGVCTIPATGLVKIKVAHSALGGTTSSNYSVTATGMVPAECNDNIDNDGDGWTDYGIDPHCTSATDNTEAPLHVAAYGHIKLVTDANNVPQMYLTGIFADTTKFNCNLNFSPISVGCTQVFDPEIVYDCTHFILTAIAPSSQASTSGATGNVQGRLSCDSGAVLTTADVSGTGASQADNVAQGVNLGSATVVSCRAGGVNGATNATGSYEVDCWEPGVAWPVETVKNPLAGS